MGNVHCWSQKLQEEELQERILEAETSRRGMIRRSQRRNGGSTKKKRTGVIRSAVEVSVRNLKVTVTVKHCYYRRTIWSRVLKLLNKFDIGVTRINVKTKKNKYSKGKIRGFFPLNCHLNMLFPNSVPLWNPQVLNPQVILADSMTIP
ncbi:uncharacterized protein LOC130015679 [Mercurialis annua]|uniref:uncharacterized protein LOC130015679 n=1 Tax=Mercurialis annua TaxID=3986 RepID=UPI0024AC97BB|nr:uncharacterized protein LOC130015679 [Mercurialis annua]